MTSIVNNDSGYGRAVLSKKNSNAIFLSMRKIVDEKQDRKRAREHKTQQHLQNK